jgi:hypothetical protein
VDPDYDDFCLGYLKSKIEAAFLDKTVQSPEKTVLTPYINKMKEQINRLEGKNLS